MSFFFFFIVLFQITPGNTIIEREKNDLFPTVPTHSAFRQQVSQELLEEVVRSPSLGLFKPKPVTWSQFRAEPTLTSVIL